jgi:hypothetical protein
MLIKEKILFTTKECELILNNVKNWNDTNISVRIDGEFTENGGVMKSFNIVWNNENIWIKNRIINWINSLNEVIFKIDDNKNLSAYYRKYTKGDYFVKHDDHIYKGKKRIYTIGIMLSKSNDLIGGDLKFYVDNTMIKLDFEPGKVYIFNSSIPHSVDMIESGERNTFMIFTGLDDIKKEIKSII